MSNRTNDERDALTSAYRAAILADDFGTESRLKKIAEHDAELQARFQGVHADILAELEASGFIPAATPTTSYAR